MTEHTAPTIPVLDLTDFTRGDAAAQDRFVQGVGDALREVGFFALEGHGVEDEDVARLYALAQEVFALPESTKLACERAETAGQRGYTPFGREHARDHDAPDLKEYWSVGPHLPPERALYPSNVWPNEVPAFRAAAETMFRKLEGLAHPLLEACARYLGEEPALLRDEVVDGDTLLRVIHYPPVPDDADPRAVRAAEHEDINFLTLMCGASAEGLELLDRDGVTWRPVSASAGQVIVDSGDMLQHLTNGFFRSTTHRVVNPSDPVRARARRFSMPCFVHPRSDVDLSPLASCVERTGGEPRYGELTAGEFLHRRLAELGLVAG